MEQGTMWKGLQVDHLIFSTHNKEGQIPQGSPTAREKSWFSAYRFEHLIFPRKSSGQFFQIMKERIITTVVGSINLNLLVAFLNQMTTIKKQDCGFVSKKIGENSFARSIPSMTTHSIELEAMRERNGMEVNVIIKASLPPLYLRTISKVRKIFR